MKPEDRKRLKQHIDLIVEHKTPVEELEDTIRRLRVELHTLRFKESQEQRFIWWIWNVYSRNVSDLIYDIMGATTYDTEGEAKDGKYALPKHCFDLMKRIDEYTEHIYDGTYLDVEIRADVKNTNPDYYNQPSNSDVSVTQDVLIDIKTRAVDAIEIATPIDEKINWYIDEHGGINAVNQTDPISTEERLAVISHALADDVINLVYQLEAANRRGNGLSDMVEMYKTMLKSKDIVIASQEGRINKLALDLLQMKGLSE